MNQVPLDKITQCWKPPERVALVTSVDEEGKPNIISVGWVMRANADPPMFAIGVGHKSKSCASISAGGEFVIGIPGVDLAREVIYCGTHSGSRVDKFAETGLTPVSGREVKAPLIGECLANMECRVAATQDLEECRIFFGEVLACWFSEEPGEPLLIIGEGSGYELVHEAVGFRLGRVRG